MATSTSASALSLLDDGELHLWLVPMTLDAAVSQDLDCLDAAERAACIELRFDRDRALYARSHAWLRRILGEYLDCTPAQVRLGRAANGKPVIAGGVPALRFSLSHTHSAALIGVCRRGEPGVDIERVRPLKDFGVMARAVLHPSEQRSLTRPMSPRQRLHDFFRVWTAKEAYAKAVCAEGGRPLRDLAVVLQGQTTCWLEDLGAAGSGPRPVRGWSAVLESELLGAHYAVSAVALGGSARVVLHAVTGGTQQHAALRPTVLAAGALSHARMESLPS